MAKGKEGKVQSDIMCALMVHPLVAWAMVVTVGTFRLKHGWMKCGYFCTATEKQKTGMSDILGQLRDGRLFCIEVKEPGKTPDEHQQDHLEYVVKNNGVAGWADNVVDALLIIKNAKDRRQS